jgi:hypothetical protein
MTTTLRTVKWSFDMGKPYPGWTDDTYWNGFLNVCVTPQVRDEIVLDLMTNAECLEDEEAAEDIRTLPTVDGRIWLSNGWAISEVEDETHD